MSVNFTIPFTNKSPRYLTAVHLSTTNSTLITAPANTKYSDITVILANTTSAPVSVTLLAFGTYLIRAKVVPANDSLIVPLDIVLGSGSTIAGFASTSSAITCTIMGNEVT